MKLEFTEAAWEQYAEWEAGDRKGLKRVRKTGPSTPVAVCQSIKLRPPPFVGLYRAKDITAQLSRCEPESERAASCSVASGDPLMPLPHEITHALHFGGQTVRGRELPVRDALVADLAGE